MRRVHVKDQAVVIRAAASGIENQALAMATFLPGFYKVLYISIRAICWVRFLEVRPTSKQEGEWRGQQPDVIGRSKAMEFVR